MDWIEWQVLVLPLPYGLVKLVRFWRVTEFAILEKYYWSEQNKYRIARKALIVIWLQGTDGGRDRQGHLSIWQYSWTQACDSQFENTLGHPTNDHVNSVNHINIVLPTVWTMYLLSVDKYKLSIMSKYIRNVSRNPVKKLT